MLADERDARWSLHIHYREGQRRQRQKQCCFTVWRITVIKLQGAPANSRSMKTAAVQWVASMTAPTDDDLARAEPVVDKLAQEQAAKLVAEERAKQEALTRVEQLTAVIHRAEQRARAMDLTIAEKSERLRSIVDEHLQDLLTENAQLSYVESWHELADGDARSWSNIFSSFRPSAEFKPDLSQFPFHDLVDFRPKPTNPESTEVFKRFPKQQAIDECLKSLSDKQIRPLCRIAMSALDLGSTDLPELDKPDEVKAHVDKMQTALIRVSQYILMLHSDVVHRRKLAALTAMGI